MGDDNKRGVYMISVAAELAGMHPQTLRIYEARGLITPKRSPKNTRLYSEDDVERLRRIQELTGELGMNLAGVERVFELEEEIERMRRRVRALERQAEKAQRELREEIDRVRRSVKRELVLYEPPSPRAAIAYFLPASSRSRGLPSITAARSSTASACSRESELGTSIMSR